MLKAIGLAGLCVMLLLVAGAWLGEARAAGVQGGVAAPAAAAATAGSLLPAAGTLPADVVPAAASSAQGRLRLPHPSFDSLAAEVDQLVQAAGASAGVTLVELGGVQPQAWGFDQDQAFTAASTYKLPLLMEEAQAVTAGRASAEDQLCYADGDWEDGYFGDYQDGACFTRAELERRVGQFSDNTAAHILVRYDGGSAALNAYAEQHGASESAFYWPNTTTSADLARLLVSEAGGLAGGAAAQAYLYPLLTHTAYESGLPAGVPAGTTVVHKIGIIDAVVNDAGLVPAGPHGAYVLAVCTDGAGGDAGWKLVSDISRAVWQFEQTR